MVLPWPQPPRGASSPMRPSRSRMRVCSIRFSATSPWPCRRHLQTHHSCSRDPSLPLSESSKDLVMTEAGTQRGMTLHKQHKFHVLFWICYSFIVLFCSFLITEISLDIINLEMPQLARASIWTVMVAVVLCLNKIEIPRSEERRVGKECRSRW